MPTKRLTGAEAIRKLERQARAARRNGREGGKAAAAALTPFQRREKALRAIAARWAGKTTIPIDQASVLARLVDEQPVTLRIAPGAGGRRRQRAIDALVIRGLVEVVAISPAAATLRRKSVNPSNGEPS